MKAVRVISKAVQIIRIISADLFRAPTFWDWFIGIVIAVALIAVLIVEYIDVCSHYSGMSN